NLRVFDEALTCPHSLLVLLPILRRPSSRKGSAARPHSAASTRLRAHPAEPRVRVRQMQPAERPPHAGASTYAAPDVAEAASPWARSRPALSLRRVAS